MHPDTEAFLNILRERLGAEFSTARMVFDAGPARGFSLRAPRWRMPEEHATRVSDLTHSLRDWPQPGRPA